MLRYRCRICGTSTSDKDSSIDCTFCRAKNSMVPNLAPPMWPTLPPNTVRMPSECPEHVLAEFPNMDAGEVASLYAKFVRLARLP